MLYLEVSSFSSNAFSFRILTIILAVMILLISEWLCWKNIRVLRNLIEIEIWIWYLFSFPIIWSRFIQIFLFFIVLLIFLLFILCSTDWLNTISTYVHKWLVSSLYQKFKNKALILPYKLQFSLLYTFHIQFMVVLAVLWIKFVINFYLHVLGNMLFQWVLCGH